MYRVFQDLDPLTLKHLVGKYPVYAYVQGVSRSGSTNFH